jgi:hypothetical protein
MKQLTVDLAQYDSIIKWKPKIGDVIVHHGWLTHWFGVVNAINNKSVTVVKAGMPILLFSMGESEMTKNKLNIDVMSITISKGGKYAVQQTVNGVSIWYV